jgi:hypothetical protein
MRLRPLLATLAVLAAALAACHRRPAFVQLVGTANWAPDQLHADLLTREETDGNGIEVGEPKIYDDASLRMMLDATRAKLAGMTGLDQSSLIASLGNISGATINQTQLGVQVSGPTPPGVATTNTGATNSTTTNGSLPAGNTTIPGTVTVATQPTTQSVVTTVAPASAPPTVPSGLAFTPPTSVSPSSLDMLNEQMQLSYEMAGLQLLLEGALSDRFVAAQRFVKPRVTFGFPISLRAPMGFRDSVAVVEVEVESISKTLSNEPPAITALLPREKTYNVAAMTDHTTSIGAGAVIGMVGLSGSFTQARKTLYLVQDQDTVALQRPADPSKPNVASFLWEFHPVLGEHFVRTGLKQTFVQIALPTLGEVPCFGRIKIRTYWRRFNQKQGTTGTVIAQSVLASRRTFPIPRFDLTPAVGGVVFEDLGDGTVLVSVKGSFLAGTYVQLGPTRYDAGKNMTADATGVKFVAPMAALARWTGHIVARSGEQADLLGPFVQRPLPALSVANCSAPAPPAPPAPVLPPPSLAPPAPVVLPPACDAFKINSVTVAPLSETDSTVRVEIATTMKADFDHELLLSIGGKVFGLRDAIVKRERNAAGPIITAVVPTALLVSNPRVRVFRPFWSDKDNPDGKHCYDDAYDLADFDQDSATERLVLVSVAANGDAVYLLYGNGLDQAKILAPASGATFTRVDNVAEGRIRLLTITKSALDTTKKVVLQKKDNQRPLVLDVPDPKATAPKVTIDSPVIQNTDTLDLSAEHAADIDSVTMDKKKLKWDPVDDSTIRLSNLKADGVTSEQKSREITVLYKNGVKVAVKFEVVAARIGVK